MLRQQPFGADLLPETEGNDGLQPMCLGLRVSGSGASLQLTSAKGFGYAYCQAELIKHRW